MKKKLINKRKKNYFNLNLIFIILALLFFSVFSYINLEKIFFFSADFIQKYSDKYSYNLTFIEINNLINLNEDEMKKYFDEHKGQSIFLFPLNETLKKIKKNPWVKNIHIKSDYKNTLKIYLEEEIPMGVYVNDNQKILFSQNLIILDLLNQKNNFNELIKFYGENAILNSKKLFQQLDINFLNFIESAIFIENRRWNIKLNNEIVLKLPESNISDSINIYYKIYSNLSNKELKEIESIDLRIKKQATIKYKNQND